MKMKKMVALLATVAMTATLLVGCAGSKDGGSSTETPSGDEGTKSEVFVGLATDEGGINDKSFNQTANDGVKRAESEFGLKYKYLESQKKEDYEPSLQALIDEGSNLTFAIGFQLEEAVKNIAGNNPDANLCLIDAVVDKPNVLSVTFKEEEGSFLMGVIAGLTTKTNKVGFIGGKDFDTINKFEAGFAAGVAAVNEEAAKGLISPDGKAIGTTVKYADSFADTNKGYELAKALYNDGVDVIYHAAGGCGIGLFTATKELRDKGEDVWAIGVDMDQQVSLPDYADVILSSMMKRVDNATYEASKAVVDGTFKGGHQELGIAEGGVGMSESTSKNTDAKVIEKAKEYEEKIKKGEIKVPATRAEAKEFKAE